MRAIREEMEKWWSLPPGERWSYFTSYYLGRTVLGIFLAACLLFFGIDFRNSQKELILSGTIVNAQLSEKGYAFLTEGFVGDDVSRKKGRIFAGAETILFEEAENQLDQYRKAMALASAVAAGELDYLIMDPSALEGLKGGGIFTDPADILTPGTLERLETGLVEVSGGEESFRVLSLEGSQFADAFSLEPEDSYLGFTCLPRRYEKAEDFVDFMLKKGMFDSIDREE